MNPFLYAVVSSKFRSAFVETVCQYCCYCNDYFCCYDSDEEFQKGMEPRGKMRRVYRRNRRFLKRQSTFNTTTTTSTSSLKNNSIKSHSNNGIVTKASTFPPFFIKNSYLIVLNYWKIMISFRILSLHVSLQWTPFWREITYTANLLIDLTKSSIHLILI